MGWWANNATMLSYFPGLFTNRPRRVKGQQWDITAVGSGDGGGQQVYSIVNRDTSLYMDLGAKHDVSYDVYLGGQETTEPWRWKITVIGQINNASYSTAPKAATSILATGSSTSSKSGAATASGKLGSMSSSNAEAVDSHTSRLGIYIGVPVAVAFIIFIILLSWAVYRKRRRMMQQRMLQTRAGQEKSISSDNHFFSSGTTTDSANTAAQSNVVSPLEANTYQSGELHEILGTPVAEIETRRAQPRAYRSAAGRELRQGQISGVAELE
jgi:hypothetical protein